MDFEDRFMTMTQAGDLSRDLEAAGFKHVIATHTIDPSWRSTYRSGRPELDRKAWTVRLGESLIPMPQIKSLVEICERHGMTFWMGGNSGYSDEGSGCEIYVRIKREGESGKGVE